MLENKAGMVSNLLVPEVIMPDGCISINIPPSLKKGNDMERCAEEICQ
jgi:hypothetical protein